MKIFRQLLLFPFYSKWRNPLRNKVDRPAIFILKAASIILAILLVSGCYNYYRVATTRFPPPSALMAEIDMHKTIIIHYHDSIFIINNIALNKDSITGSFSSFYVMPFRKNAFPAENASVRYMKKKGDQRLIYEVHLYLNNLDNRVTRGTGKISFALKDISRLDVYNQDTGRTVISWIAGGIVGALGLYVIVILFWFLIIALSGGSCPLVYVNNGNGYSFAGEIYSGAVYSPLERNDYLVLPQLVAENGSYKIKLSNELREIQNTNLTELYVVDHPAKSEVLVDKYGRYQTATELRSPVSATTLSGDDILGLIKDKDSICYYGIAPGKEIPLTDGVIMTFVLPEGATSGKIFLRARNSWWLEYVYKNSHELFGNYYIKWLKKQNRANPDDLKNWSLSQNIPLSLFVEKDGKWIFYDYFNMAGPMALKDDVIAIDLKGFEKGPLKVKLESGTWFWEIDYAGIDFSANLPVDLKKVQVENAVTNNERDVTEFLRYDDLKYYTQNELYNSADLSFPAPSGRGEKRTVILHSKGYYHIINETGGLPRIRKLKELRESGQFLEFSRELMKSKIEEFGLAR